MLSAIHDALLIYNPTSGRHRHRRLAEVEEARRILYAAGIEAELAPTTTRGSATVLARQAVADGRELVLACGGDGTVNEAVNGLAGSPVPLGVLPAGTANILAKELGIPWDIPAAARRIPDGSLRRIGLGQVRSPGAPQAASRYFLCVAGAGPDGAMVHALEGGERIKSGIISYWLEGFRQLIQYDFPEFVITSEGRQLQATLVVVGRTQHYGGPFRITRGASLFDDSFEIVAYTKRSRLGYLTCLPALWMNRLRRVSGIHFWKTMYARCEPAGELAVYAQVDGEPIGRLPLEFQVVPDALTLVIPSGVQLPAR